MVCQRNRSTYRTKKQAIRHGYITYGETKTGRRKFIVYKVKKGWNVVKIKK